MRVVLTRVPAMVFAVLVACSGTALALETARPYPAAGVEASSERRGGVYQARNAADESTATAWAEGADGPGKGEWLEFTFEGARRIGEVRIVAGVGRSALFRSYGRPRAVRLDFSDGSSRALRLADVEREQRFPVEATADRVRLVILETYSGTAGDVTAISEVVFAPPASEKPPAAVGSTESPGAPEESPPAPSAETTLLPSDPGQGIFDLETERMLGLLSLLALALAVLAVVIAVLLKESEAAAARRRAGGAD